MAAGVWVYTIQLYVCRLVVTHRTVRGLRAGEGVPHVQAVAMRQRHTLQGLQADGSVLHVQAAGMR